MFLMVLMIAISGGSSVLVAHAYGARDRHKVSEVASRSIIFMVIAALMIVTPLGILFSRPTLVLLGGTEEVVRLGEPYLHILFAGSIFTMFNFAVTGILLGVGKTRISLYLLIVINFLNIFFNYILIFGLGSIPAYGINGAALGTVLARALGSIAGIWILKSPRFQVEVDYRDALTFDWSLLQKILALGGPRSLQGIVRNFSRLMTIRIITLLPDATRAVSAYTVGMQVRMVSSFIGLAFMSASMTRVGQNMGGKHPELAEKSGWISAGMAMGLMTLLGLLFFLFPGKIMAFFTSDRAVIEMGTLFFVIIALSEPIMALAFALSGALRGGGDPISPFVYSSISDLLVVLVAGYIFAVLLQMGFTGIAVAVALSAITRAVPTTWKFRQGNWKAIRL